MSRGRAVALFILGEFTGQRVLDQPMQLGHVLAFAQPDGHSHPSVDRDRVRARHQHPDQLSVRIERGRADGRRRVA